MQYEKQLQFLQKIFAKCNIQLLLVDAHAAPDQRMDYGFRQMIGQEMLYRSTFYDLFAQAQERVIYRMNDTFLCNYIFFLLPDEKNTVIFLGPYLSKELTHEDLLDYAEENAVIAPDHIQQIEHYYASIPILEEGNLLFAALDAFAEEVWGDQSYNIVTVHSEYPAENHPFFSFEDTPQLEESEWNIRALEMRYAFENELMEAVSLGQTHKADLLLMSFSKISFERRLSDPVRNLKNYCIIMNTLLRKAAQNGGVHPLYLDKLSSECAHKIEALSSTESVPQLMTQMFNDYCRLVKKQATHQYSPTVQKTVLLINLGLSGDLSLHTLAETQNVNASYLSSLFKKETGKTVTDYINEKRMKQAAAMLSGTKHQIQTVAQHCGISDVNYFSKLFRKYFGKTPKEYRKEHQR